MAVVQHWPGLTTETPTSTPRTREERDAEYLRRERVVEGEPYTTAEIVRYNLFVAVNESNERTATTRRVDPLLRFVVGVDAAACASNGVIIRAGGETREVTTQELADVEAARLVWSRSRGDRRLQEWAMGYATRGDIVFEAQLHDDGPRIVAHHPSYVECQYDPTGSVIERAVMKWEYVVVGRTTKATYSRELTQDKIITTDDGADPVVKPNPIGMVPLSLARWGSLPSTHVIGSWAGHGLEAAVAMLDSATCQVQTVGSRHANPLLVMIGARPAAGDDPTAMGQVLPLPPGGDAKWLEAALQGVESLVSARASLREQVERLCPELLFVDAGASSSGTALSYRAGAFVAKIEPPRQAFYAAIAEALSMAVAMGAPTTVAARSDALRLLDSGSIVVDGGPVLPGDRAALATMVAELAREGLVTRQTAVSLLQGASIIDPDADPTEYAAQARADLDDAMARAAMATQGLADTLTRLTGEGQRTV